MNKIRKQPDYQCYIYAIVNALEYVTGHVVPDYLIQEYIDDHGLQKEKGGSIQMTLNKMKVHPLDGFLVKSWDRLLMTGANRNIEDGSMSNVRRALNRKKTGVVGSFRKRKGGFKLDERFFYHPTKDKIRSYHAMHIVGIRPEFFKRNVIVENTKGEEWGDNGLFYMGFEHILTECSKVYGIEFYEI